MCYYLSLRIDKCNQEFKVFANRKFNKLFLMKIIREHNNICIEIANFNKFWRFYLLVESITLTTIIAFMLCIECFADVIIAVKFIFISFGY